MKPPTIALVAIGGAIGAVARYELTIELPVHAGQFPCTTLAINVAGSFALGLLLGWLARHTRREEMLRPLVGIGVLGAFTTFSTVCTEAVLLAKDGHTGVAFAYVLLTLVTGLAAALLGLRTSGWQPRVLGPKTGEE